VTFVYITEIFEPVSRVVIMQFCQCLFGISQALMALMAYYITNWRTLSVAFAIPPAFIFILVWIYLDESARWLMTTQKYENAMEILTKMAKQNGRVRILQSCPGARVTAAAPFKFILEIDFLKASTY